MDPPPPTEPRPDEKAVFTAARQLPSAADRRAYLDQTCGSDPDLYARVEALLRVHDKDRSFLEPPTAAAGPDPPAAD
ncbi:MAG TPA: hypothetical protein VGF55_14295, partial [Gemmataceae bacterium]